MVISGRFLRIARSLKKGGLSEWSKDPIRLLTDSKSATTAVDLMTCVRQLPGGKPSFSV